MKIEITEILQDGNNFEEMYYDIIDFIQDLELNEGFESLNGGEKSVFLIEKFVYEANNGGFDQYLDDTDEKVVLETLTYLEESGNRVLAGLLKRAVKAYDTSGDEDAVAEVLNGLNDEFYEKIDYDEYYRTIIEYIKNNDDRF